MNVILLSESKANLIYKTQSIEYFTFDLLNIKN